jgi:hypothetical protein
MSMKTTGVALIVGASALAALLLAGWLLGLVFAVGGALIHLLLLLAPVVAGVTVGIILIAVDRRK